jgi:hypothetical protein
MIHKKEYKDSVTGEVKTRYTSDRPDCKVVLIDGKPIEKKMDIDERRSRRDGQIKGKFKQKGVTKQQKKNERLKKEREENSMKRDIESKLKEFIDVVEDADVNDRLTYRKSDDLLSSIDLYLNEKEEKDKEEEDEDEDIENIKPNKKEYDNLSDEDKKKVKGIVNKLKDKIKNSDDDVEDDDSKDDDSDDVEDDDSKDDDSDDVEDNDSDNDSDDDSDDVEDDDSKDDDSDDVEDDDSDDVEDDDSDKDELEIDNEIVDLTKEFDFNIDNNNCYDYYEFLLDKIHEESSISKINSAYMKIIQDKRKITPARELLSNINDIYKSDSEKSNINTLGSDEG